VSGDRANAERRVQVTVGVGLVLAAGALVWQIRAFGLLGWDTFPLIEVSRIAQPGDLLALFRESMLGESDGGIYFRPLAKLTFSLDYALFGLWAPGYHATTALLIATAAWSVHTLASRLLTPPTNVASAWLLGPAVALVTFVLHPALATVAVVPARRPEILCLLFSALALAAQTRAARRERALPLLPALFAALAIASKETGFALVGLCPLVAVLGAPGPGDRLSVRLRRASLAVLPVVGVVIVGLIVRALVLGGSGFGDRPFRDDDFATAGFSMLALLLRHTLGPEASLGRFDLPLPTLLAAGVASAFALASAAPNLRQSAVAVWLPATGIAAIWIAGLAGIYSIGIVFQPWYAVPAAAAFALAVGAAAQGLWILRSASTRHARFTAIAGLALLALLTVQLGRYSPLLRHRADWAAASRRSEMYLASVADALRSGSSGEPIVLEPPPRLFPRRGAEHPHLSGIALLAPYSVEAWIRLAFPSASERVVEFRRATAGGRRDAQGT
jgi:hypothetical protein